MNKPFKAATVLLCCILLFLTACGHEHVWKAATCTEPAVCEECGKTDGEPLGHKWVEATCTEPKTCSVCGETEGEALGHDWAEATHESPETCTRCGETRGEPLLYDVPAGLTTNYRLGEFDRFNSYAIDNGLGGTMIWFNGTYEAVANLDLSDVKQGLSAYIATVTDEEGNNWFVQLDLNEYGPVDKYSDLANHQLCILGEYQGYSDVYQMPAVQMEKVFDRTTGDLIFSTWYSGAD